MLVNSKGSRVTMLMVPLLGLGLTIAIRQPGKFEFAYVLGVPHVRRKLTRGSRVHKSM